MNRIGNFFNQLNHAFEYTDGVQDCARLLSKVSEGCLSKSNLELLAGNASAGVALMIGGGTFLEGVALYGAYKISQKITGRLFQEIVSCCRKRSNDIQPVDGPEVTAYVQPIDPQEIAQARARRVAVMQAVFQIQADQLRADFRAREDVIRPNGAAPAA